MVEAAGIEPASLRFKPDYEKPQKTIKNHRCFVTEVSDDSFCVKDVSGQMQTLYKNELKDSHWDYSYTYTSYSIQGSSSPFVIGVADTQNKKTNHCRSFYIMVSRGSLHAMIYTDNYDKLKTQLRVTPNKISALEEFAMIPVENMPRAVQEKPYKISMTDTQIKNAMERISRENKLGTPLMKSPIIKQKKILQRVEMEIS
jgi:hypothetical protein